MKFDKAAIMKLVTAGMADEEKNNRDNLDIALATAIEEFALLVKGKNYIKKYSQSISANTREVTLKGDAEDIKRIFAVKISTSSMFRTLDYCNREEFLDRHDNPNALQGSPYMFTQLELSGSRWPIIKFERPTDVAYTLEIYYYTSATAENVIAQYSVAPLVSGTKAHFFGIDTSKGKAHLARFHDLGVLVKGNETLVPDAHNEIKMSKEDIDIRATVNMIRKRRT